MTKIRPDQFLIIIGAMKCATTSLFEYLSQHPAICPSVVKEPEFFTEHQEHQLPVRSYEEIWPSFDTARHRYALEASVGYTKFPAERGVAERMHEHGIRPRLIYVVRDPIERIESHVNYIRTVTRKRISFEDSYPVDVSRYATQLDPFVEVFGRDVIQVVDLKDMRADPARTCTALYEWLGLESHPFKNMGAANQTTGLQRSHLDRLLASNRTLRRIGYTFPPEIRDRVRRGARKLFPYRHHELRIAPERVREVRALLREDMNRLAREWGVDVRPWGFYPPPMDCDN